MSAKVAASAFAASVFVIFLLWATKSLGLIGLLGAFSAGLISYSIDSSIETAVAAIILVGIAIKYLFPLVQVKWVEAAAMKEAFEGNVVAGPATAAPANVIQRIQSMKGGAKEIEGFKSRGTGATQYINTEGFQDASIANASLATAPATAGGVAVPGATVQSSQAVAALPQVAGAPAVPAAGGVPSALMGNTAVGVTDSARVSSNIAALPAATPGTITVPVASPTASAPMMVPVNTMGAAAPSTGSMAMAAPAANVSGVISGSTSVAAARAAPMGSPVAAGAGAGATPLTAQIPGASGSIAAPVGPPLPSTLPSAVAQPVVAQPGVTPGTAVPAGANQQATVSTALAPAAGVQGFGNIEKFQADGEEGLFKLGQLPTDTKNGPHIDAGTTIMRALSSLNPGQINSLTEDTRKLLDTQKSLMGMLSTMKPILSDGAGLLSQFQGMFGK